MHLIDSHCHLDFSIFDLDRDQILSRCNDLGIKSLIIPAVTVSSWQRLLSVCAQSKVLHPALGLHPMFMQEHKPEHIDHLKDSVTQHKRTLVAIGEIGLDFYLPDHDKQAQTVLFTEQLKIAQDTELPVLLHVRKAHDQTVSCLKKHPVNGGIVHAFNGSMQQADHYQKLGFLFGVGGAITHPNATRLRSLMAQLPLSSLVLETDSPDMPIANMIGTRNSPENIPKILATLAELRSETAEEIALITTQNCQRLIKL